MRALVAAVAVLVFPTQAAFAQLRGIKADLAPVVESDAAPGRPLRAALLVRIPERFHVQSDAPRDPALIPTELTVDAPPGVTAAEVVFPEASEFDQLGQAEPLLVFENEFAIGVRLELSDEVALGPLEIPARLRYQACDERLCYAPVTAEFTWAVTVVSPQTARPRQHADLFDRIAFGTGRPPTAAVPRLPFPLPTAPGSVETASLDEFTVAATAGGYLGAEDFLQFIRNAETGVREQGLFEGRGPLAILLLVLLGGLALNLTPCVLPMIPINLAIIGAGTAAGSRSRGFLLGSAYGAAMAVVYGLLGLIVILTAGTFGAINASPWFNLAIAAVFVALALAMFDVFAIDLSRFSSAIGRVGQHGSFAVAFVMGAVAALLAGACVAPVVIQVVVFSSDLYARGTVAALALPFLLGLGMAVPWPLAGAGLTALPKPGPWMVRVKQAFGVLILATAAYYGYLAYGLFADRWVDADEVASSVQEKLQAGWYSSLDDGLAAAQREQKPVLIDMWATWCKNCLVMDQTTLADRTVTSALDGYVKIKFQAEQPGEEPARAVMERFEAVGLPTYVILHPKTPAGAVESLP